MILFLSCSSGIISKLRKFFYNSRGCFKFLVSFSFRVLNSVRNCGIEDFEVVHFDKEVVYSHIREFLSSVFLKFFILKNLNLWDHFY